MDAKLPPLAVVPGQFIGKVLVSDFVPHCEGTTKCHQFSDYSCGEGAYTCSELRQRGAVQLAVLKATVKA